HKDLAQRTLAQVLGRGLDTPAGYCLPLGFNPRVNLWQTCAWQFRQGALYLLAGNSPLGLRLPLASLARSARADFMAPQPVDPFAPLPQELNPRHFADDKPLAEMAIGTALCAEVRDGYLYVFMPPTSSLEEFVGL